MNISSRKTLICTALTGLILLGGCTGTQLQKVYLVNPVFESVAAPASGPCISLGIGPVRMPDYLDRPQIVMRTTRSELLLARFDRWAEPLTDTLPRVLAQNLSRLLCIKTVSLYPFRPSVPKDYRLDVEVIRLDGMRGHEVTLEAWWSLSDGPGKKVQVSKRSKLTEPTQGNDFEALVEAHSRVIGSLCRDIAQAIAESGSENSPAQ